MQCFPHTGAQFANNSRATRGDDNLDISDVQLIQKTKNKLDSLSTINNGLAPQMSTVDLSSHPIEIMKMTKNCNEIPLK